MFRHLFVNTVASAAAFFAVSLIGILLVPVLVGAYGLAHFGLIVLARALLPTGLLALFDFGFSELSSQSVAEARESRNWDRASREVSTLLAAANVMGLMTAALLFVGADTIARLFSVESAAAGTFADILRVTSAALLVLFPAIVLEGVVKGFAAFRSLRLIETLCTLGYAGAALVLVWAGQSYAAVAYVFLASTLIRAGLITSNAIRAAMGTNLRLVRPDRAQFAQLLPRCKLMGYNRVIGVLQFSAQTPLVGVLLGASSAAIYDVLVRVPRFAKSVIAVLGSALIPVAARLNVLDDQKRMTTLASWGVLLFASCTIPPLLAAAVMSEPLLRLWVGPSFAVLWHWHALMFTLPIMSALTSFGTTALLVRPHAVGRLNWIGAGQTLVQYALAFSLLGLLQERAFMLAQCVAIIVAFPMIASTLVREHKIEAGLIWRLGEILGIGVAMAGLYLSLGDATRIESWSRLGGEFVVWCVCYWLVIWLCVLDCRNRRLMLAGIAAIAAPAAWRSSGSRKGS